MYYILIITGFLITSVCINGILSQCDTDIEFMQQVDSIT